MTAPWAPFGYTNFNEGDLVKAAASVSEVSSTNNLSRDLSNMGSDSMIMKTVNNDDGWEHMISLMSNPSSLSFPVNGMSNDSVCTKPTGNLSKMGSDSMIRKTVNNDDGWERMISLRSTPSSLSLSFPVNGMSNDSISAKTTVNSASYSSSLGYSNLAPQTPIKGSLGLGESQMACMTPSGAHVKHVTPVSHSHAGNNLQPAMVTPQLGSHYYAIGYEKPNIYYQEGSSQIEPNMTCSMHQYPASDYVTACSDFLPGYSNLAPRTPIKGPLGLNEHQMALSSLAYHNLAPQTPIKGPLGSGESQMASSFSSYSNLAPQTPKKGTLCLGESQMAAASRCPSGANIKHSHSHASDSIRQSCLSSHYYANEHEKPNLYLYYQDGSNQIQPDVTCSKHQSQILHPASDNVTAFPNFLPNGLPVPYQAQSHYTLNHSSVSSTLGITNSSKFPPSIPHPASNSGNQHNLTTLPVDQNPGVQASLTMTSYPSAPFNPSVPNNLELHLQDSAGLYLPPDRSKNHVNIQLHTLAVHPVNDPDSHDCQVTTGDIIDYPTAICTPHKERDSSETEEGQNFDLNKTPSQKTPKRRKHRPKVIREKKSPKTSKPSTPKMGPDGTKVAKRKYVRKKKANLTDTLLSVIAEEGEASNMEPASKTCRRSLNFDLENDGLDQTQRTSDTNCDTVLQGMGSLKKIEDTRQLILESVSQKHQEVSAFRQPSGSVTYQSLREEESSSAPSKSSISSLLLCQDDFQNKRKKVNNGYHSNIREIKCSTIHAEGPSKNQRIGHMLNHSKVDTNRGPGSGLSSSLNQWRSYSSYYCVNAQRHQMPSIVAAWPVKTSASGENQSASSHTLSEHGGTESTIQAQKSANEALSTEWTGKSTVNRTVCCSILGTMPINQSQSTALDKKHMNNVSVEDLVEFLGCLKLRTTNNETEPHNLSALVPYKADGSIVPYEKFEALKKRKARPKVDLDQETNRLWNVLMGKVITEDEKNTDEEKAKWWEEERRVFRGRADSFIARMHLVQGDRRFSPWKGSVVDSVIGVFLTQNVTDHVSSSAFMSLAAKFQFRPTKNDGTCLDDRLSEVIQEPDVSILETNGERPRHKELDKNIYARTSGRLICQDRHDLSSSSSIQHLADAKSWGLEEVISSQDSAESSNLQATGGIQSFLKSTSKDYQVKDENPYSNHNTSFDVKEVNDTVRLLDSTIQVIGNSYYEASTKEYLQFQNAMGASEKKQVDGSNITASTASQNLKDLNLSYWQLPTISSDKSQFPLTGSSGLCSAGILEMQNLKCSISMDSSASGVTLVEDTGTTNEQIGPDLQGGTVSLQNRRVEAHYPLTHSPCAYPDIQSVEVRDVMQKQVNEALQTKIKMSQTSVTVHDYPGQTAHVDGSIMMVENRVSKERVSSSTEESSRMKKYEQNSRSRDSEGKRATFDWDSLRKQAQASSNLKERSKETADSMDYEALRHADVKDISQAIRERGMNNMLAERMKDFLNRVAQDHGSVDLEWLRDVPPEKAKDYLLSIRGLGLKSVECVRLLTLHQHAFPVDTNVGRIAVRLGWVPLQPLPESLQLHLLELYPVLESIQKYLWPRLCNLDQRTLYELHYQLITFGKVFCTKSKPNCNACPMRGECRHFASAFASSRLALPGPEDKSIIISDFPINATRIAPISVNSLPLRSLEGTPYQVAKTYQGSEPIVEEPSTPEPEITETLETDIEDVYEDSDEIPTIRLNVEEFATNLQNFMQGNMELQEGDMSKALVALDPKAASIPTPRLKNVSRLRTEHQVYQLSDSHPLLKELEEREPDDPSPYLLAIWTPGETAESIQPPEGKCSSQELGRMCGENTCFTCNSIREGNSQTVRGTLLIPCRTATRGSFPLNGTYFQVNEVFADHESSLNPINVPRSWIWNLQRRTVYFGTSATTIFKGMSTEDIQYCFWRGFVCVRGFDRNSRSPRPLMARLHFPASKRGQPVKEETNNNSAVYDRQETEAQDVNQIRQQEQDLTVQNDKI